MARRHRSALAATSRRGLLARAAADDAQSRISEGRARRHLADDVSAAQRAGGGRAASGVVAPVAYAGVEHQHYRFGPITLRPGQNPIVFEPNSEKPSVPGYITRFQPDLVYTNGKKPRVDVLHLHHGVWSMRGYPTFAVGEEKTITQFPRGFGYRYDPSDPWILNHMLHNLTPASAQVYVTWDIDFVPASSPAAAEHPRGAAAVARRRRGRVPGVRRAARLGQARPLHVPRRRARRRAAQDRIGAADHDARGRDARRGRRARPPRWPARRPEGVARRRTKTIFRSEAKYYEPAGAVSWDASMTFTKPDWRVAIRKGDELSVSATYDTSRASWYEVMGIIDPLWYTTPIAGAPDPFTRPIDIRGAVTHGHLPENDNHGGTGRATLPDARRLADGTAATGPVDIKSFVYALGSLTSSGAKQRPPTVRQGGTLTFRNLDSPRRQDPAFAIYHTITACKAPCNKATGIAYPLADSARPFDSGELGFGPRQATAAANRVAWKTPKTLSPGTYSYFCRVHPFMRGAFRVKRR